METSTNPLNTDEPKYNFYIGLTLAISSSLFIGSSFIIKKISLTSLKSSGNLRAGAGGFGYLKDWIWWLGFLTMGVGELANFAAYAFAPASLVTPLGALSVLVSAVLATKFLKESLNTLGKVGCVLCLLGSTVIVIHAPKEEKLGSLDELLSKLQDPAFINYVLVVCGIVLSVVCFLGPRYGSRYVIIYVTLCSAIGSLTVMACKGLGIAIKESISDSSQNLYRNIWIAAVLLVTVAVCICIQMNYLNKVLDLFSATVVTPIYYVMFTTMVIVVSAVLFKEWKKMDEADVLGTLCGFFVTVIAVFMLNYFKEAPSQPLLRNSQSRDYGVYYPRNI